jgi:hypothetical protein
MKQPKPSVGLAPTPAFHQMVALSGGIYPASKAWGIEYASLSRFMEGGGAALQAQTIAAIMEATSLSFDTLFEIVHDTNPPTKKGNKNHATH